MACEVISVQEPMPMQLHNSIPQDMAMAQPYVVAMLVPAATLMMPNSNAQVVPNGTPSNQSDYAQSPWGQEMQWQSPSMQPMGQVAYGNENYQFAPDYGYDDRAWEHDQRSRRRRKTNRFAQPKAPGMVPATGRQSEDDILHEEQAAKLREQLEAGGVDHASAVATTEILGSVWPFSRHPLGCRVVQEAIKKAKPSVGKAIAAELQGHVKEAVESPHANYVLQKVIEQLSSATSSFIADELIQQNPQRFARHRFGCRIVCRLVEHCSSEESTYQLINVLLENRDEALNLCKHNFGHHVVQSILEHGDARHKEIIAEVLHLNLLENAKHRSSSYVLEAALLHCSSEDQESLVSFLLQPGVVAELAKSDFGVFVVRTLLKHPLVDAEVLAMHPEVAAVMNSESSTERPWDA